MPSTKTKSVTMHVHELVLSGPCPSLSMYTLTTKNSSLEKCWHLLKKLLKIVDKHRNVLPFLRGAVKKVLASLEKCYNFPKELLKSICKLKNVLAFAKKAVKKVLAFVKEAVKNC